MYRNIADEMGVKHQLCTFHLFQTINHKLKVYCRRNKINKKQREHIYENAQELKNCFRQNSTKEAIGQFKQYLQNYMSFAFFHTVTVSKVLVLIKSFLIYVFLYWL